MRLVALVVWRLRHSKLRASFHMRVVQDLARSKPQGWVVDIGSGPGLLAHRLSEAQPGVRVVCIDVTPEMVRAARKAGCSDVVRATADRLPIRTAACSTAVSTATLKDWANRAGGLSEISRILVPGGNALVYDFVTVGPGSKPQAFLRRFGIQAELLRRLMARMIPFSLNDLEQLATEVRGEGIEAHLESVPDLGAAKLTLVKLGSA